MSEAYLGQIQAFGFNFPPRSWALCEGQLLPISQNQALFSLLGTIYGGDGRQTFALPDLRGRLSLHFGDGPGLTNRPIGQKGGEENHTLTVPEIAGHHHSVAPGAATIDGDVTSPENNYPANRANGYFNATNASMASFNSADTGNSQGHNNMEPFLVINWCICIQGLFPPRN